MKVVECSICQVMVAEEATNNAMPINKGRCCHACDNLIVTPVRIARSRRIPIAAAIEDGMQLAMILQVRGQKLAQSKTPPVHTGLNKVGTPDDPEWEVYVGSVKIGVLSKGWHRNGGNGYVDARLPFLLGKTLKDAAAKLVKRLQRGEGDSFVKYALQQGTITREQVAAVQ